MTDEPTISVPTAEYLELLECRRRLDQGLVPLTFPRSPIDRDAEVAAFLLKRFGMMPVKNILVECAAVYGSDRTPSMSATYRFWDRVRVRALKTV